MSARTTISRVVGYHAADLVVAALREAGYHLIKIEREDEPWDDQPYGRMLTLRATVDDEVVLKGEYILHDAILRSNTDARRIAWERIASDLASDAFDRLSRRENE